MQGSKTAEDCTHIPALFNKNNPLVMKNEGLFIRIIYMVTVLDS